MQLKVDVGSLLVEESQDGLDALLLQIIIELGEVEVLLSQLETINVISVNDEAGPSLARDGEKEEAGNRRDQKLIEKPAKLKYFLLCGGLAKIRTCSLARRGSPHSPLDKSRQNSQETPALLQLDRNRNYQHDRHRHPG